MSNRRILLPCMRLSSHQGDIAFEDGNFYKKGIGGPGLYISPSCDIVLSPVSIHMTDPLASIWPWEL
jgi:hypothetical protein